ncbi:DNA-binding transcriptional MerR regulator [Streptomyces sp. BK239]|nr:MerR family transcriptional regulator [Streptomyces sp. BK239]RZU18071.1 DNA-binding transcriptional MerR regulator [Streptomyces sp. BK239]
MDGDTLYSIGELARRTGLTVKTIRFYSDRGIVAPTDRSPAGYRLYGIDAVARLSLVRTLRELGLDLPTIRKVVDRELSLPEVAAAHAEALAVQIRVLRLRRAVLMTVAERGSTPEETELMHRLAQLSEDERRRLIDDFLDAVFGGFDAASAFAGVMRALVDDVCCAASVGPVLPGLPEHVQATVREGDGGRFVFLLNHGREEAVVTLPEPMTDALGPGGAPSDRVTLPPAGVAVLTAP